METIDLTLSSDSEGSGQKSSPGEGPVQRQQASGAQQAGGVAKRGRGRPRKLPAPRAAKPPPADAPAVAAAAVADGAAGGSPGNGGPRGLLFDKIKNMLLAVKAAAVAEGYISMNGVVAEPGSGMAPGPSNGGPVGAAAAGAGGSSEQAALMPSAVPFAAAAPAAAAAAAAQAAPAAAARSGPGPAAHSNQPLGLSGAGRHSATPPLESSRASAHQSAPSGHRNQESNRTEQQPSAAAPTGPPSRYVIPRLASAAEQVEAGAGSGGGSRQEGRGREQGRGGQGRGREEGREQRRDRSRSREREHRHKRASSPATAQQQESRGGGPRERHRGRDRSRSREREREHRRKRASPPVAVQQREQQQEEEQAAGSRQQQAAATPWQPPAAAAAAAAVRPEGSGSAEAEAGAQQAACDRENVEGMAVGRGRLGELIQLEDALQAAAAADGNGQEPPSLIHGLMVRYRRQKSAPWAQVVGSKRDEQGGIRVKLQQGSGEVSHPLQCICSSKSLKSDEAFGEELQALSTKWQDMHMSRWKVAQTRWFKSEATRVLDEKVRGRNGALQLSEQTLTELRTSLQNKQGVINQLQHVAAAAAAPTAAEAGNGGSQQAAEGVQHVGSAGAVAAPVLPAAAPAAAEAAAKRPAAEPALGGPSKQLQQQQQPAGYAATGGTGLPPNQPPAATAGAHQPQRTAAPAFVAPRDPRLALRAASAAAVSSAAGAALGAAAPVAPATGPASGVAATSRPEELPVWGARAVGTVAAGTVEAGTAAAGTVEAGRTAAAAIASLMVSEKALSSREEAERTQRAVAAAQAAAEKLTQRKQAGQQQQQQQGIASVQVPPAAPQQHQQQQQPRPVPTAARGAAFPAPPAPASALPPVQLPKPAPRALPPPPTAAAASGQPDGGWQAAVPPLAAVPPPPLAAAPRHGWPAAAAPPPSYWGSSSVPPPPSPFAGAPGAPFHPGAPPHAAIAGAAVHAVAAHAAAAHAAAAESHAAAAHAAASVLHASSSYHPSSYPGAPGGSRWSPSPPPPALPPPPPAYAAPHYYGGYPQYQQCHPQYHSQHHEQYRQQYGEAEWQELQRRQEARGVVFQELHPQASGGPQGAGSAEHQEGQAGTGQAAQAHSAAGEAVSQAVDSERRQATTQQSGAAGSAGAAPPPPPLQLRPPSAGAAPEAAPGSAAGGSAQAAPLQQSLQQQQQQSLQQQQQQQQGAETASDASAGASAWAGGGANAAAARQAWPPTSALPAAVAIKQEPCSGTGPIGPVAAAPAVAGGAGDDEWAPLPLVYSPRDSSALGGGRSSSLQRSSTPSLGPSSDGQEGVRAANGPNTLQPAHTVPGRPAAAAAGAAAAAAAAAGAGVAAAVGAGVAVQASAQQALPGAQADSGLWGQGGSAAPAGGGVLTWRGTLCHDPMESEAEGQWWAPLLGATWPAQLARALPEGCRVEANEVCLEAAEVSQQRWGLGPFCIVGPAAGCDPYDLRLVAPDGAGYLWGAEGIAPGSRGELLLLSGAGVAQALEGWVPQEAAAELQALLQAAAGEGSEDEPNPAILSLYLSEAGPSAAGAGPAASIAAVPSGAAGQRWRPVWLPGGQAATAAQGAQPGAAARAGVAGTHAGGGAGQRWVSAAPGEQAAAVLAAERGRAATKLESGIGASGIADLEGGAATEAGGARSGASKRRRSRSRSASNRGRSRDQRSSRSRSRGRSGRSGRSASAEEPHWDPVFEAECRLVRFVAACELISVRKLETAFQLPSGCGYRPDEVRPFVRDRPHLFCFLEHSLSTTKGAADFLDYKRDVLDFLMEKSYLPLDELRQSVKPSAHSACALLRMGRLEFGQLLREHFGDCVALRGTYVELMPRLAHARRDYLGSRDGR